MTKDYEIGLKVRNGYFLARMRARGFEGLQHLAAAMGENGGTLYPYLNLKASPILKNGDWSAPIKRVAKFLRCRPEDLFPAQHIYEPLLKNEAVLHLDIAELGGLLSAPSDPEALFLADERTRLIEEALSKLTDREASVLRKRFGFDGDEQTFREVGKNTPNNYGDNTTSPERIRQIELRALRKLRQSSMKRLREAL